MEDHINVAIRIRPLSQREQPASTAAAASVAQPWHVQRDTITQRAYSDGRSAGANSFTFDKVFDQKDATIKVYDDIVKNIITSSMSGFNGTIFAYGQTSSGKTHTMYGSGSEMGIIKLAVKNMFDMVNNDTNREYLLRVSFLEIYNEVLRDLLEPSKSNLKIHENSKHEIFVGDLSEHIVFNAAQVEEVLQKGDRNRHIAGTNMNERSSRSHTIFRIVIESREKAVDGEGDDIDGSGVGKRQQRLSTGSFTESEEFTGAVKVSCLNLVDLAGSERVGQTGAEGQRLKEGAHINKSLLALGTVIGRLSEDGGDRGHVPYRDSKLTRILQPSLGGNAKTLIICTITPSPDYADETLSTLKFASRAKTIRNTPEVNEELRGDALLRQLKRTSELEKEVAQMKEIERKKIKIEADNEALLRQLWKSQKERERLQQELESQQNSFFRPRASVSQCEGDTTSEIRRQTWFPGLQGPVNAKVGNSDDIAAVASDCDDAVAMDTDGGDVSTAPKRSADSHQDVAVQISILKAQSSELHQQNTEMNKQHGEMQTALDRVMREYDLLLSTLGHMADANAIPTSPAKSKDDIQPRELVQIRRKIRALMATIEASQKQCRKFRSQRAEAEFLEMEMQSVLETLAEKEEELVDAMRESDEVFAKLRDVEAANASLEQTCQDLRTDLQAAHEARNTRQHAESIARAEIERAHQTALICLQEGKAEAEQLLESTLAAHSAEIAVLESEASQRHQAMQDEVDALRAAAVQAQSHSKEIEAELLAANERVAALMTECQNLTSNRAEFESKNQQHIEQLIVELRTAQSAEAEHKDNVVKLQTRLEAQQARLEVSTRDANQRAEDLSALRAANDKLQSQLGEARADSNNQAEEHASAMCSMEVAYKAENQKLQAQLEDRTDAADALAIEVKALREQHQRVEEDNRRVVAELATATENALKGELQANELLTLRRELESRENTFKQLSTSLEQTQSELVVACEGRTQALARIEQLGVQNAEMWERVSELTASNGDLSTRVSESNELAAKQKLHIDILEGNLAEAVTNYSSLQQKLEQITEHNRVAIAEADQRFDQLQSELDESACEVSNLREALQASRTTGDGEVARAEELLREKNSLASELNSTLSKLAESQTSLDLLSTECVNLQREKERAIQLQTQLESAHAQLEDLQITLAEKTQSAGTAATLNAELEVQLKENAVLIAQLETQQKTLNESLTIAQQRTADLQTERVSVVELLESRIHDLESDLNTERSASHAKSQTLQMQTLELREEITQLTKQLSEQHETMKAQTDEAEKAQLAMKHRLEKVSQDSLDREAELTSEHARKLAECNQALASKEETVELLRHELKDAHAEHKQLEEQITAATRKTEDELATRLAVERAHSELQEQIANHTKHLVGLQDEVADLRKQRNTAAAEAQSLCAARDCLQTNLAALEQRSRESQVGLEEQIALVRDELSSKEIALSDLEAALERATASASAQDQSRAEVARLEATVSELKEQLADLQASMETAEEHKRGLDQARADVTTLKAMMTELAQIKDDEITGLEQRLEEHNALLESSIGEGLQKDEALQQLREQIERSETAATDLQKRLEKQDSELNAFAQGLSELVGCANAEDSSLVLADKSTQEASMDAIRSAISAAAAERTRLEQEAKNLRSINEKLDQKSVQLRDMYKADMIELRAQENTQRQRAESLAAELEQDASHATSLAEKLGRVQSELVELRKRCADFERAAAAERPVLQQTPGKHTGPRKHATIKNIDDDTAGPAAVTILSPVPPSRLNTRSALLAEADCPPRKRIATAAAAASEPAPAVSDAVKAGEPPRAHSSYGGRRRIRRNQPHPPRQGTHEDQSAEQCVQQ
ncbi:hypothetical protein H4S08_000159 [Coemansia sp. RSA 1365]|nr:hypothetical protein H4S08_000159 [Coemansia sp. RSA 1365]